MKKDKDKEKKKGKVKFIIALISALLVVAYFYFKLKTFYTDSGLIGWGFNVLLIAVLFASFAFFYFVENIANFIENKKKEGRELDEEEKKSRRKAKVFWICLVLALFGTGLYTYYNFDTLLLVGPMKAIVFVCLVFGFIFALLEMFSWLKPVQFDKIVMLPYNFLVWVIMPMLPFWIILIGAIDSRYPSNSKFLESAALGIDKAVAVLPKAFTSLITRLYSLGFDRPVLWIILVIGAFLFMTYRTVKEVFVEPEKDEDDLTSQEIIDQAIEDEQERQDKESGKVKKNWLDKFDDFLKGKDKLDERKKEEIEHTKADSNGNKYDVYMRRKK